MALGLVGLEQLVTDRASHGRHYDSLDFGLRLVSALPLLLLPVAAAIELLNSICPPQPPSNRWGPVIGAIKLNP